MINPLNKLKGIFRSLDTIEEDREGGWNSVYLDNILSMEVFSPIGRYVFWRSQSEVQDSVGRLRPHISREGIKSMKYALEPLEGDPHFPNLAIVVYADSKRNKSNINEILISEDILDHQWLNGHQTRLKVDSEYIASLEK